MTGTENEDPAVAWEAWLNEPIARWTCTRGELIEALTHLQASVPWPPPIQRDGTIAINAESMADAILAGLTSDPDSVLVPVTPPDFHRLVSLALAVTEDDAGFVERMRAVAEPGP